MIENLETPTDATSVETPTDTVEGAVTPPEQFDIDKADNVSQLREHAKSLKTDLGKYKPAHEFISSKFGDTNTAEIAHSIYTGFAGEQFDPETFEKVLEQLSPSRAKQLIDTIASKHAQPLAQQEVEKLFGGKATPEDIKLFKQFKENGFGLGQSDDIPEALKFNADGSPKSDEEIEFLRNLHRQVKETRDATLAKTQSEEQEREQARQTKIQQDINSFSNERLKILDKEFETYGLTPLEGDTAEQRQQKETLKTFIMNGVSGLFLSNPEFAKDYESAVEHIQNGENLLARRYETKIETKLLDIMRSKALESLFSSFTEPSPELEVRPEISKSGASPEDGDGQPKARVSSDDIYADLVSKGIIKP